MVLLIRCAHRKTVSVADCREKALRSAFFVQSGFKGVVGRTVCLMISL